MLAIMTAETTWRIDVPEVVRIGCPIDLLIMEYSSIIDRLNFSNCILDCLTVLAVIIKEISLVIFFDIRNSFHCLVAGRILY